MVVGQYMAVLELDNTMDIPKRKLLNYTVLTKTVLSLICGRR